MLLDTNVFLFFVGGEARLKKTLRAAIADPAAPIKISAASLWEMTIKHRIGKLPLPAPFSSEPVAAMANWCDRAAIQMLELAPRYIGDAMALDFAHNDPFDRVIAATAIAEGLELVTSDRRFKMCQGLRVLQV